jgi:O-antigen/teichoic acid export membrane protein
MKLRSPRELTQRGRVGFLLRDSALYGGAAALSKAFSLITFPLLARHFSTADYGVVDFFGVLGTLLAILIIFGQDSAVARFFYEHEEFEQRQQLISVSLGFQLLLVAVLVPVLWIAAPRITGTGLLVDAPGGQTLFRLVLLQAPFLVLMSFSQNLLKWTFERTKFLIVSIGLMLTMVSLIAVGVLWLQIHIAGLLLIGLSANAVFGLLGLFFVRQWLVIPQRFGYLRELLPYAVPLGVICTVGAFVPTVERWLIADLLGSEDLGLYAAGMRIAMLVTLFVGAFQTAWGPFSLSLYKQADAVETYNWVMKGFVLAMLLLVFALAGVAHPLIVLLASERYALGALVVFPIALGLAVQAISWITEIGIGLSKRSYLHIYAYVAYVVVTVGGILLLAPRLGLTGVALGVALGYLTKAGTATWLAQRAYPMEWAFGRVGRVLALSLVFGVLGLWTAHRHGPWLGAGMYGVGFLVLALTGAFVLFSQDERQLIRRSLALKLGA